MRKKLSRRQDKSRINIFKALSVFLIIVFIGLTPITVKKLVIIKKVTCNSQYGECPNDLELRTKKYELSDLQTAKKQIENELRNSASG